MKNNEKADTVRPERVNRSRRFILTSFRYGVEIRLHCERVNRLLQKPQPEVLFYSCLFNIARIIYDLFQKIHELLNVTKTISARLPDPLMLARLFDHTADEFMQ